MSYTPTTWTTGDTITATALNKMEQGIASAGGGISGLCTDTNGTLDKSYNDVVAMITTGVLPFVKVADGDGFNLMPAYYLEEYEVDFLTASGDMRIYIGSSADGALVLDE